jgi:hypothetical protein
MGDDGIRAVDIDKSIPKKLRGRLVMQFGKTTEEDVFGSEDWGMRSPGDVANSLYWRHDPSKNAPRGVVGSYSDAFVAIGNYGVNMSKKSWLPLKDNTSAADDDFEPRDDISETLASYGGSRVPGGVPAMVVASTGHGTRHPFAFTSGGPLVADHESPTPPEYSRHVFDMDPQGNLDQVRHAGLHSIFRVRGSMSAHCVGVQPPSSKYAVKPPKPDANGGYAIYLNGTRSTGDHTGWLPVTFAKEDALFSYERNGPLVPAADKFLIGVTSDARHLVAGGISTDAYHGPPSRPDEWWGTQEFVFQPYIPPTRGPFPVIVEQRFDKDVDIPGPCGTRKGQWRWETWSHFAEPPMCVGESEVYGALEDGNMGWDGVTITHSNIQNNGLTFQPKSGIMTTQGRPVFIRP